MGTMLGTMSVLVPPTFLTDPGRLYIVQSTQHKLPMPPTHHQETLSLRPADVGRIGCYEVGQNECSLTTNFATAPGRLDIARVSDDMVPPADNQLNNTHCLIFLLTIGQNYH